MRSIRGWMAGRAGTLINPTSAARPSLTAFGSASCLWLFCDDSAGVEEPLNPSKVNFRYNVSGIDRS